MSNAYVIMNKVYFLKVIREQKAYNLETSYLWQEIGGITKKNGYGIIFIKYIGL